MSFPEEEQHEGAVAEPSETLVTEPRLLTRPDRPTDRTAARQRPKRVSAKGHKQVPAESGLRAWSDRLAKRRSVPAKANRSKARTLHFGLWAGVLAGLTLLLMVAGAGVALYLRHAMQTALPALDGSVQASGLRAPVTVTRDAQGTPTITASNLPDLLFAQGYTTAGDRLWQMDGLRRHAAGELAEVLGSGFVEHDRRQRVLQIRAAADRAVAQLPPDQLAQLEAYARGVNAYIDAHRGALPIEFRLLAYSPKPWVPRDTLLVSLAMWQDLSTEFPRKMDRDGFSRHLPPQLLADLYPVGSWRDQPPANQGRDLTAPHEVEQIPLDPSQSGVQAPRGLGGAGASPASLLAMSTALGGEGRCEGCRSGSNNWAVSGSRTASGAPLLANDMHLSLAIPDIWYEASLHAARGGDVPEAGPLDVTGFTLPGVPFVIVGRNAHVAWGVTNLGADVQDVRVEHLRGSGEGAEYQRADGSWAAMHHRSEVIQVRGGRKVTVDVTTTTHPGPKSEMETPVISGLYPGEGRALSLAWTAYDPAAVTSPFLGVNTAGDGASLVAAFASFGGPALNLVWADSGGHIGYHALGLVPVRGPAVQHPRAVQAPIMTEPGELPPDEGSETPEEPSAALLEGRPHLILSAYQRGRRGRAVVAAPSRRRVPVAVVPARGRRGRSAAASAPRRQARVLPQAVEEAPLPPAAPVVNYTIGSPISALPVDALDPNQLWSEYVPYDALPAVVDPKNGWLATANARITPDDSPYALANDWADPFRVERIVHVLAGRKGLTPADMLRLETDVHSDVNLVLAQRVAYAIDHADASALGSDAGRLHAAANVLRGWDGSMDVDSGAAAIVSSMRTALWPALLVPKIMKHDGVDATEALALARLYTWGERTTALELLVQHTPARWLPKPYANWNDFLAGTLASALHEAHAPSDLRRWRYGDVHTTEIAHPLFSTHRWLSRIVGVRATTGAQPAPGDATTVDAIGAHFGPSERFVADLSSAEGGLGNVTTGESANPRSPWYLDQFAPWLAGRSFALPSPSTGTTHTLTLTP